MVLELSLEQHTLRDTAVLAFGLLKLHLAVVQLEQNVALTHAHVLVGGLYHWFLKLGLKSQHFAVVSHPRWFVPWLFPPGWHVLRRRPFHLALHGVSKSV